MENSTIGIKIADGTYYPIIEDGSQKKKKLILTTVNDNQESVQIDLYKGRGAEIRDASYIGSLLIEDIVPAVKGDPEIELRLGIDADGNLNAEAGDVGSGERQSLSVSLESLGEGGFDTPNFEIDDDVFDEVPEFSDETVFDDEPALDENLSGENPVSDEDVFGEIPDFSEESLPPVDDAAFDEDATFDEEPGFDEDMNFDEAPEFDEGMSFEEETDFDEGAGFEDEPVEFDSDSEFEEEDEADTEEDYQPSSDKKRKPFALVIVIVLILIVLGIGAFLFLRGSGNEQIPPLAADKSGVEASEPEYAEPAEEEPVIKPEAEPIPPAAKEEVPAAVTAEPVIEPEAVEPAPEKSMMSSAEVPPVGRGGGVWYRLKWGDTLWNLSISFYRTPWLYGLIAVENNIKNPDLIYAGTDLFIPEN